jgi:hypothetical protein
LKDVQSVATELDKQNLQLLKQLDGDVRRDSLSFAAQVAAEQAQWQAKINVQEAERKRYLGLYQNGHTWAKTYADNIQGKSIPKLKADMQAAIQVLHTQNSKRLDELNGLKRKTFSAQLATKTNIVSSTQAENASTLSKTEMGVQKWGGFLAVLAIVSTFFTLFCLSFIEAYEAGILPEGKGVTPPPSTRKKRAAPNWFSSNGHTQRQTQNSHSNTQNRRTTAPQATASVVAQDTPSEATHKDTASTHTHSVDYVSMDKLIKRTRQQFKRSREVHKSPESRATNRQKAEENIELLRSLGVRVEEDKRDRGKLVVIRKEVG